MAKTTKKAGKKAQNAKNTSRKTTKGTKVLTQEPKKRATKSGINRVSQQLIQDVVTAAIGEQAMPIVEYLKGRKDISEFQISKAINLEVAFIRRVLYQLQNNNLVTYFRKKDREKGWYISYWTFNPKGVPDLAIAMKKNKIAQLRERLEKEKEHEGLFYICPSFCSRMEFERATEESFRCPECGKALSHQDNSRTIAQLKENILLIEQEVAVA